jgi:hypothetical protein
MCCNPVNQVGKHTCDRNCTKHKFWNVIFCSDWSDGESDISVESFFTPEKANERFDYLKNFYSMNEETPTGACTRMASLETKCNDHVVYYGIYLEECAEGQTVEFKR